MSENAALWMIFRRCARGWSSEVHLGIAPDEEFIRLSPQDLVHTS